MTLRNRLEKLKALAGHRCAPEDCDCAPTLLSAGEAIPPDLPRCPRCGEVRVTIIEEIVVTAEDVRDGLGGIPLGE
jgi:hypothetical protein